MYIRILWYRSSVWTLLIIRQSIRLRGRRRQDGGRRADSTALGWLRIPCCVDWVHRYYHDLQCYCASLSTDQYLHYKKKSRSRGGGTRHANWRWRDGRQKGRKRGASSGSHLSARSQSCGR